MYNESGKNTIISPRSTPKESFEQVKTCAPPARKRVDGAQSVSEIKTDSEISCNLIELNKNHIKEFMSDGQWQRLIGLRQDAITRFKPVIREKSFCLLIDEISRRNPKKILEVGCNEGLSSVAMLLAADGARLTAIEIDEDNIERAKQNLNLFGLAERVRFFCADAADFLAAATGGYDFIFLDGPKGHYGRYLDDVLRLLNSGGVLFADNVLFRGYVQGKVKTPHRFVTARNSLREFLHRLTHEKGLETSVFDIEDGVSITEKKY